MAKIMTKIALYIHYVGRIPGRSLVSGIVGGVCPIGASIPLVACLLAPETCYLGGRAGMNGGKVRGVMVW